MSTAVRVPGKYGRRKPKHAPALRLSRYLTGNVPAHPAWVDYLATMTGWQMLGNDTAGDCVAVTWANMRWLVTTALATGYYPTQAQVWEVYQTQNPGFDPSGGSVSGPGSSQDNGMDIQTLLEYLVATGGPDAVKAVGFAAVDYTNPAEVQAALDIFGCIWTGLNVLDQNMTEFADNQPWDYSATSAVDGGHSVVSGGYGDNSSDTGQLAGDVKFITWAQETSFTDAFWSNEVEEAWVVIWPEMLGSKEFVAAMDMATFAADYTAITGKPFPVVVPPAPAPTPVPPVPPPAPVPTPTPVPPAPVPVPPEPVPPSPIPPPADDADLTLWETVGPWLRRSHFGERRLEKALEVWAKAKELE